MSKDEDNVERGLEADRKLTKKMSVMEGAADFLKYSFDRYYESRVSIIQDGLVGGMFLTFLLDTFVKCKDETFINVFMLVGILHYVSINLSMLNVFGRRAVAVTNTLVFKLLQHLVKLAMFPSIVWLAWFVLQFNTEINGVWTFEEELVVKDIAGDCKPCYCDVMYVSLAELVVAFQVLMGAARLLVWAALWYIGPQDRPEEKKGWSRGGPVFLPAKIWAVIELVSLHGFFLPQMASIMVSLAVALPHRSCSLHVTEWFLRAGVVFTLTSYIHELQREVEHATGGIHKAELVLINFLKLIKLPLFIFELVCYFFIVDLVRQHATDIIFQRTGGHENDMHYCEESVWNLMIAVTVIYGLVLLFRIGVVLSSVVLPDGGEEEMKDEGEKDDLGEFEVQILRPPHHKKK